MKVLMFIALTLMISVGASAQQSKAKSANSGDGELIAGDKCGSKFGRGIDALLPGGTYQRYCRPPLFHPTTAFAAFQLREEIKASAKNTNQPQAKPDPQVEDLNNRVKSLEERLSKEVADEEKGDDVPAVLKVIAPAALDDTAAVYTLLISDQCTGGTPDVTVNPETAKNSPLAKVPNSRQYKQELTSKNLLGIDRVQVTVIGCQASNRTFDAALAQGEAVELDIPVANRQISTTLNVWARADVKEEFGEEFSRAFIVADAVVENTLEFPVLVYGSSLRARVRFLLSEADVKRVFGQEAIDHPDVLSKVPYGGDKNYSLAQALDFTESYRPLTFSDVLAISTFKRESDPRQRSISALKSLGTLLTAGTVFKVGKDYVKNVAFFTGAFVPELEKQLMWDILLHVKNLETRSFREVEEIAGHQQLRKVVFFPRRPIEGIVPFAPLYIAEITPDEIPLTAVVLQETKSVQGTPATPPAEPSENPATPDEVASPPADDGPPSEGPTVPAAPEPAPGSP